MKTTLLSRIWRNSLCMIDWHTHLDDADVYQGDAPLYQRTYVCRHCDQDFEI